MVGELPSDFLSFDGGQHNNQERQQINADEETARALQYGAGYQQQGGVPGQLPPCVGRLSITVAQVSWYGGYGVLMKRLPELCNMEQGISNREGSLVSYHHV